MLTASTAGIYILAALTGLNYTVYYAHESFWITAVLPHPQNHRIMTLKGADPPALEEPGQRRRL